MLDKPATDELSLTLRFFDLILPEQGVRIVEYKSPRGRGMQRAFASTNEELCELVRRLDHDGFEVYHACATYKEMLNDPPGHARQRTAPWPHSAQRYGRVQLMARR